MLQEVPHLPLSDLLKAGSVMRSDQAAQALCSHFYPVAQVNIKVYFSLPDHLHSFFFLVSYHILYLSETFFTLLKYQTEPMCPEPVMIVKV